MTTRPFPTTVPNPRNGNRNVPRSTAGVPARREYRERDFGVGYGRSSGYGSNERPYAASGAQAYFRCR